MTGQDLKNSILQLAIQGKLVPQDANDEPASVLLERIKAEKQKLINEKKIKKEKPLPEITDEEKPFEIPESWEWVRVEDIATVVRGGSPRPAGSLEFYEGPIPFMCVADITKDECMYVHSASKSIKEAGLKKTRMVEANTLLLSNSGATLGVPKINTFATTFNDGIAAFLYLNDDIKVYLYWYYKSQTFILRNINQGTAQPNLNTDIIKQMPIPLPPLSEQHRIVAKIEELMPLVEEYDKAQKKLDALNAKLPEALKKSILQEAIQGKLVPQDQNDEPASVLLQHIRKEKEQLVKDGKLKKKDLVTTPITDEEKPFEIPESWEWVRLANVGITNTGTTPSKSNPNFFGDYIPFLGPGDIQNSTITYGKIGLSELGYEVARPVPANSIIQVCIGGSIGKCAIVDRESTFNQQINSLTTLICNHKYLFYCMQSDFFAKKMIDNSTGTATPIINRGLWDLLLIPLPPLSEQHRIVSKIEDLFAQIEPLAKALSTPM